MTDVDILPAPVLELPAPRNPAWGEERAAFYRLLPELLRTHRDRYVAIYQGKVVAEAYSSLEAVQTAYHLHGYVPVYVSRVTEQPLETIRIPFARQVADG